MTNKTINDFNKPTTFSVQNYGKTVVVEFDHSDLDIDEVMDAFQTLIRGMGYADTTFKEWVLNEAEEYKDDEWVAEHHPNEALKEAFGRYVANLPKDEVKYDDYGQRKTKTK